MEKYTKKITVTEEEWSALREEDWSYVEEDWEDEDYEDPPIEYLYKTGDVKGFIDKAVSYGKYNPGVKMLWVLESNPSRNYDKLLENIHIFWNWLLEKPEERLPNRGNKVKLSTQETFDLITENIGGPACHIKDPYCSAKYFLLCFGNTFEKKRVIPLELGPKKWTPTVTADPNILFEKLIRGLGIYLFTDDPILTSRNSLMLLEYWFSLIPHIDDKLFFSKKHFSKLTEIQCFTRVFFGNLKGYDVNNYDIDVVHNDPEMEEYITNRLSRIEMPKSYQEMIAIIDTHKDKLISV